MSHAPYRSKTYQMAGHSQSPAGSFATTSTLPYLIVLVPLVVRRADRTGGMIVPVEELLKAAQLAFVVPVQVPSAVRFSA
jgi:hypothetical protein